MPPFGWRLRLRKPAQEKPATDDESDRQEQQQEPPDSGPPADETSVAEDSLATVEAEENRPPPVSEVENTEGIPEWLVDRLEQRLPPVRTDSLTGVSPEALRQEPPETADLAAHEESQDIVSTTPVPSPPPIHDEEALRLPESEPPPPPVEVSALGYPGAQEPSALEEPAPRPPSPHDSISSLETTQVHRDDILVLLQETAHEESKGRTEDYSEDYANTPPPLLGDGRASDRDLDQEDEGVNEKTGQLDLSTLREIIADISPWSELPDDADAAETPGAEQNPDPAFGDATPTSAYRGTFRVGTGEKEDLEEGDGDGDAPSIPLENPDDRSSRPDDSESFLPGDTLFEYSLSEQAVVAEDEALVEALSAEWELSDPGQDTAETPAQGDGQAIDTATSDTGAPSTEEHDAEAKFRDVFAGGSGETRATGVAPAQEKADAAAWSQERTDAWHGPVPAPGLSQDGDLLPMAEPNQDTDTIKVEPGVAHRYRVLSKLGQGGAGLVTEVHDIQLDRPVALKMARTDMSFATPEDSEAWLRRTEAALVYEARLTARLEDPRIVPVHDLGRTQEGRVFFTMKHVRGVSLGDVLAGMARGDETLLAEYSLNRRLTLFVQMCLGMAFAHDQGVIHRDLKPGNIMVGEYGTIQIIDWGLARFLDAPEDAPSLPKAIRDRDRRVIQGTPGYMAPEQALGDYEAVDHRTDIYALGAILYEMLTFHAPIEMTQGGESLRARLYQLALGRFPPPSEAIPGLFIPPELDAICMKALAGERTDRFQDARSLAREVENYLEGTRLKEEAARLAERGRKLSDEYRALQGALQEARRAARLARERTPRWAPVEEKEMLWALEDNEAEIAQRRTVTFADAVRAFHEALGYDRESTEARNGLAEIYWTRVVEMEEEGLVEEAHYYEREARQYDTGALSDQLAGLGRLVLSSAPPGLEVDLFRYHEAQRRLVPAHHATLARTPVEHDGIPMGSYLAILHRLGFPDIQYPIWIRRGQTWKGHVAAPEKPLSPEWVFIPGGPCVVGGDPKAPGSIERAEVDVPSFCISRFPVTCGEYCKFLNMLNREEAQHRVPRRQDGSQWVQPCWWRGNDGHYFVPRRDREGRHWHKDLPITCVSWEDAQAFARWKALQLSAEVRLPTENEWEKAARGVDGRPFPWGEHFDPAFCKMSESRPGVAQPEVVGTFPTDESPYGVRDMAGGTSEWVDGFFDDQNLLMTVRGGGWNRSAEYCRAAARSGSQPRVPNPDVTFRLVMEC